MTDLRLVLASGSPRRRDLLNGLGLDFVVRPVDLDESVHPGEEPVGYVRRLAREKARARAEAGEILLAADTIVVLDGEILGKPSDPEHACRMLGRMAGRRHQVLTGVAVYLPASDGEDEREVVTVERTSVEIAPLSPKRIAEYVATGEPLDKAGSYGIQGLGALLVETIEGNYTNVVGLPLPATARLFRDVGHEITRFSLQT